MKASYGGYRVLRAMPTGGQSYLARSPQGTRAIVHVFDGSDNELRSDLALAAQLDHPAAAVALDTFDDGDELIVVFEQFDGPTLDRLLLKMRQMQTVLDPAATWYVAHQLAGALAAAHALENEDFRPLCHGFLSTRQISISFRGDVLLSGFGLASRVGSTDIELTTRAFEPPEQTKGGRVTPRGDVYSLAAIIHAMLSGREPAGDAELSFDDAPEDVREALAIAGAASIGKRKMTTFDLEQQLGRHASGKGRQALAKAAGLLRKGGTLMGTGHGPASRRASAPPPTSSRPGGRVPLKSPSIKVPSRGSIAPKADTEKKPKVPRIPKPARAVVHVAGEGAEADDKPARSPSSSKLAAIKTTKKVTTRKAVEKAAAEKAAAEKAAAEKAAAEKAAADEAAAAQAADAGPPSDAADTVEVPTVPTEESEPETARLGSMRSSAIPTTKASAGESKKFPPIRSKLATLPGGNESPASREKKAKAPAPEPFERTLEVDTGMPPPSASAQEVPAPEPTQRSDAPPPEAAVGAPASEAPTQESPRAAVHSFPDQQEVDGLFAEPADATPIGAPVSDVPPPPSSEQTDVAGTTKVSFGNEPTPGSSLPEPPPPSSADSDDAMALPSLKNPTEKAGGIEAWADDLTAGGSKASTRPQELAPPSIGTTLESGTAPPSVKAVVASAAAAAAASSSVGPSSTGRASEPSPWDASAPASAPAPKPMSWVMAGLITLATAAVVMGIGLWWTQRDRSTDHVPPPKGLPTAKPTTAKSAPKKPTTKRAPKPKKRPKITKKGVLAAPAAKPSPSALAAALAPGKGILIVAFAKTPKAEVFVLGKRIGTVGEPIEVACGKPLFLRLGTMPGPKWVSGGQPVVPKCQAVTSITAR